MIVDISLGAERDLEDGYWFYERQSTGLGDYFRSCIISDIEALAYFGGIHPVIYGFHRSLSKRFPFGIYYERIDQSILIVAVLDLRSSPSWIRETLDGRQ